MAEKIALPADEADFHEHAETYRGFLKGSVFLALFCFFILVALVNFRFDHTLSVFSGFAGLILGAIALIIDARAGGRWYLSGGLLVVYALITAINIA